MLGIHISTLYRRAKEGKITIAKALKDSVNS